MNRYSISIAAAMLLMPSFGERAALQADQGAIDGADRAESVRALSGRTPQGARRPDPARRRACRPRRSGAILNRPNRGFRNQYEDGFQVLHPKRRWWAARSPCSSCRRGRIWTRWRTPKRRIGMTTRPRSTCCSPATSWWSISSAKATTAPSSATTFSTTS